MSELSGKELTLSLTNQCCNVSALQVFLKQYEKRRIACKEQFLLFPTVFSTLLENFLPFTSSSELLSANSFSLDKSTYVVWERVNCQN